MTDYMGYTPYKFQLDKWVRLLLILALRATAFAGRASVADRRAARRPAVYVLAGTARHLAVQPPGTLLCSRFAVV